MQQDTYLAMQAIVGTQVLTYLALRYDDRSAAVRGSVRRICLSVGPQKQHLQRKKNDGGQLDCVASQLRGVRWHMAVYYGGAVQLR